MLKIYNVEQNSLAQKLKLKKGDCLLSINNIDVEDIFDYTYIVQNNKALKIKILSDEKEKEYFVYKSLNSDLGVQFEEYIDKIRTCQNRCIFCFIDQLPKGMRRSLYIKDDDSRLSLLTGNYITLTNLTEKDFEKIVKYKISPLKISVHTTNPELRAFMLNNQKAKLINEQLEYLYVNNIEFDVQIVLVPDINDKQELKKTISDLESYFPKLKSIAVVPVGITKYREKLFKIRPFEQHEAKQVLEIIEDFQKEFLKKYDTRLVFAADEFYLKAQEKVLRYWQYEEFRQIENGVGMLSLFSHQFKKSLKYLKGSNKSNELSLITGAASYEFIKELIALFNQKYPNIKVNVYKIINDFFGEHITVTGLLTGQDIIKQLKQKKLGRYLIIPLSCINDGVFLDDVSISDVENALNVACHW